MPRDQVLLPDAPAPSPPQATALGEIIERVEELVVRFDAVNTRLTGLVLRLYGTGEPVAASINTVEPPGLIARLNTDVDALLNAEDTMAGLVRALEDLA